MKYDVSLQATREGLENKRREGLAIKINKTAWTLSDNGKELPYTLTIWKRDYTKLLKESGIENPLELLDSLKVKKLKYNSE